MDYTSAETTASNTSKVREGGREREREREREKEREKGGGGRGVEREELA